MDSVRRRSVLICGVAAVMFALVGLGAALASAIRRSGPFATRGGHRGLSAQAVLSGNRAADSRVIVILRNQVSFAPATRSRIGQRIKAESTSNAGVESQVQRSGGHIYKRYHALNAFAATVSSSERSTLQKSSSVAQVVPDTVVALPATPTAPLTPSNGATGSAGGSDQALCPSDPSKPLLEPEALQTTHTAFNDPTTPQAQSIATGKNVKVAFFADGLDINNPDFIRPDGSHVFIDYKDFSGDGPNAVTGAAEAFGDASSIAAQGRITYDISQFVNPAHPLPAHCNINVRGVAPGASLIGIKVFGNANTSFNSVILQGLDYALTNDHPDVISESFGGYPIPDTTQDLTRQFNEQAVAAGVTVVESSGDSGVEASPSSASSDPSVIAAGASTTFRNYAQGTQYAYRFAHGWISDNISSIESAGFTMAGRVLDLVAPGEANWALCSPNTAIYTECVNYAGKPTPLQSFGGTSESAPLIAGGSALIIQAYRDGHGGKSPSPGLVRQLLTSTATDLHFPSVEQGAGEMNTLDAVQAAKSLGNSTASGQNLLVGPTQLDISGQAGTSDTRSVNVTNLSSSTQMIHAHARAITRQLSNQTGTVTLGTSPTFIDQFGTARPYQTVHFSVPAGADRLLAFDSWPGPLARVGMTLIDPSGKFAAYTRPQGDGDHGEVDVHDPAPGTWTAIIFLRDGTFTGPVQWQFIAQDFGTVDSVSPSTLTLGPGQTGSLQLSVALPSQAGDISHDLELDSSAGKTTIVPVLLRSLVNLGQSGGSFSGDLIGGNGRNGPGQPGQIDTVDFQVPAGQPELSVALTFSHDPGTQVYGALIDPSGSENTAGDNVSFDAAGHATFTNGLQAYVPSPRPGRWRFVVDVLNPVGGQVLSAPYQGQITFAAPPVQATGLPNSASMLLPAGKPAKVTVSVDNNGVGTQDVFLDPRTPKRPAFSLLSITPDTNIALPIPSGTLPPVYLVPTETNAVDAFALASEPVTFDFGWGDPDLAAISSGNTASAHFSTHEATPGLWSIAPDPIGPFSGPAPAGTVSTALVAHTLGFDLDTSSSTGDIWRQTVDPKAPAFTPVTLAPGQHGKLTLTITPSGRKGRTVRGTLFVDEFNNALTIGGELVALPYEYTVG
jgi:Subtilase family/Peptidase inhibitor I9